MASASRVRFVFVCLLLFSASLHAGEAKTANDDWLAWYSSRDLGPCNNFVQEPGLIWAGKSETMTFERLVAYAAPVIWFSPDEPLLRGKSGRAIDMPIAFPFEEPSEIPVGYYRVRRVFTDHNEAVVTVNEDQIGQSLIDLRKVAAADIDFKYYYPFDVGVGGHKHDIEGVTMKLEFRHDDEHPACPYAVVVNLVMGSGHGVRWYMNELEVTNETVFPVHISVEEGKHASCPDQNADGYYTPGYDVNRRTVDAWGLRDTIRSGRLYSGTYEAWMSKVRKGPHRVFPPLPADSIHREAWMENDEYAPENATYQLRPFPRSVPKLDDQLLATKIKETKYPDWPYIEDKGFGAKDVRRWLQEDSFTRKVSLALRFDTGDLGLGVVVPLLLFKHVEMPLTGGYFLQRFYLKDYHLRDFGWGIQYSPSASRWVDWYTVAGFEYDEEKPAGVKTTDWSFVYELGFKFRFRIPKAGWWGFRTGMKYAGFSKASTISYVIEVGEGAF